MNLIVTDLSDNALINTPHYRLDVHIPLFLKFYNVLAFSRLKELKGLSEVDERGILLRFKIKANMVTHLASSQLEHDALFERFIKIIDNRDFKKLGLSEYKETIFYTALHLLAVMFGETTGVDKEVDVVSGANKIESRENLKSLTQLTRFYISHVKSTVNEVKFTINKRELTLTNTQLTGWIVRKILDSIRDGDFELLNLGIDLHSLSGVLNGHSIHRNNPHERQLLLEQLDELDKLPNYKYIGALNYRIAKYCLALHKLVTYITVSDSNKLSNIQLRFYAELLKLFQVYDFVGKNRPKQNIADQLGRILRHRKPRQD